VSVSWEHAYGDCPPGTAELLRVVCALDLTVLSSPAAGVAAGLDPDQAAEAVGELVETGWVKPGAVHPVAPSARRWLAGNAAALIEPDRATAIIRAFTSYHADAVDPLRHDPAAVGRWFADHHAELLAAVRACDRTGLRPLGTALAAAVWRGAGQVGAPELWQEFAEAGEAVAVADRDPAALVELLHRSAAAFATADDRLRAEAQWVRALAIARRALREEPDNEPNRIRAVSVVTDLAALYRRWGRLSKALDADLELVELHRAANEALPTAQALARVAETLRTVGRLDSAADYFEQADAALAAIGTPVPDVVRRHARVLESCGRVSWQRGEHGAAKRHWSRALAMAIDVDDAFADRLRALLATAPSEPLPHPAQEPNTSSSASGGNG
jgi:tetratricopeptide (TPR) repeat protein